MRSSCALVVAALLACGCYTYGPLSTAEPVVGTRVAAGLTTEGSRGLSDSVGPEVDQVEGRVLGVDSTSVVLAVSHVESIRGVQTGWKGERLVIPRAAVDGWRQRRLSAGGTGLLGGIAAGGLYAIYRLLGGPGILEGRGGGTGGGGRGS